MQPISSDTFLEHAKAAGIGFDPRYPDAHSLTFLPPNEHSRFWIRPQQPTKWPHFVLSLLNAAGACGSVVASPRRGTWPDSSKARHVLDRTRAVLIEALGVPSGWRGAVEFDSADRERLIAILVIQFLDPVNDLYVMPSQTAAFLQFSHHDVVHVASSTPERIESVVTAMAKSGYEIPDAPPDATFKRPSWMVPRTAENS
jgi:hypothetical protein